MLFEEQNKSYIFFHISGEFFGVFQQVYVLSFVNLSVTIEIESLEDDLDLEVR
jgi:hypothetical protein